MSFTCNQLRRIDGDYYTCILDRPHNEAHADKTGWHWRDSWVFVWREGGLA